MKDRNLTFSKKYLCYPERLRLYEFKTSSLKIEITEVQNKRHTLAIIHTYDEESNVSCSSDGDNSSGQLDI